MIVNPPCSICHVAPTAPPLLWCEKCERDGMTIEGLEAVNHWRPRDRPARRKRLAHVEWLKCGLDPLYWMDASRHAPTTKYPGGTPYVFTHDPHPMYECTMCDDHALHLVNKLTWHLEHKHNIVLEDTMPAFTFYSQIPATRPLTMFEYIAPTTNAWLNTNLFAIEKSRDMMATWLMVILHTWDVLFHFGRQHIFQSDDASKTYELITRVRFIYEHQPRFLKTKHKAVTTRGDSKSGVFRVESMGSEILGFPQGADQIRQYHPSGLFQDEAAYQVQAAAAFAAAKPALQQGGRYSGISSASPGWFQHICEDSLDDYLSDTGDSVV